MSTERHAITVSGLPVEIVRKNIKNLHFGVYPPTGRVRVAAPIRVSNEAVRLAVIGKLGWIKRQQARFERQPRESAREMVSGESHYFLGQRYRLRVVAHDGPAKVVVNGKSTLQLHVRTAATAERRGQLLQDWYREELRSLLPGLFAKWQRVVGVHASEVRIKRMKTKWGTCNREARRVWLNLELIKKPIQCLDYIVVHELVHFVERHHSERFIALMDKHMPLWRLHREELNAGPLAHENWSY